MGQRQASCLNGVHTQQLGGPLARIGMPGGVTGSTTSKKHQPFKVMHLNAEGDLNKEMELQHTLHKENINLCCIQQTHFKKRTNHSKLKDTRTSDETGLIEAKADL